MEKTTLYLPRELKLRLKDAARQSGKSQAKLIRDSIEANLDGSTREFPRSIGMGKDGGIKATEAKAWVRRQWDEKWQRQAGRSAG